MSQGNAPASPRGYIIEANICPSHFYVFRRKLLEKLPHTVRGMGVALLGGHQPIFYGHGLQQGKRHRLGNLAGFIVVVCAVTFSSQRSRF